MYFMILYVDFPYILSDTHYMSKLKNSSSFTRKSPFINSRKRNLLFILSICLLAFFVGSSTYLLGMQQGKTLQNQLRNTATSTMPAVNNNSQQNTVAGNGQPQESQDVWKPVCESLQVTDFQVKVASGDGATHIARKAVSQYFNTVTLSDLNSVTPRLTAEENIFAEDHIRKHMTFPHLSAGTTISVSCSLVEDATLKARETTIQQKENLEQYGDTVFEHQIGDIIQEELNELYKTNPGLKRHSGSLDVGNN